MSFLFLFLDGIGLGKSDRTNNPLLRAKLPTLEKLLGGQPLLASSAPYHGERAALLALDAALGACPKTTSHFYKLITPPFSEV